MLQRTFSALLVLLAAPVFANDAWRMPLVGRLDLPRLAADTAIHDPNSRYSGIWGYTDPITNREYALLGCNSGTSIVDITDSAVEVGYIPALHSVWREIRTYSHYAFVSTEARGPGQGIQIIDLADPTHARLVKTFDSTLTGAHSIQIAGNRLFCNGTDRKLRIINISDPLNPFDIGIDTTDQILYIHDSFIVHDTLFAAHIFASEGVGVYTLENPMHPRLVTKFTYPQAGTHNIALSEDHRTLVTTDEIECPTRSCKLWDISDIATPHMVGECAFSDSDIAHNAFVNGNYMYVAHYSAGVCVWEISDPSIPTLVGYYDTYPTPVSGFNFFGAWGTYCYFPSGKVVTSDRTHGLYVNSLQTGILSRLRVTVLDSASGQPIAGARVSLSTAGTASFISTQPVGYTDVVTGRVGLGISDTGVATVAVARDIFSPTRTVQFALENGATKNLIVVLGSESMTPVAPGASLPTVAAMTIYPNPASNAAEVPFTAAVSGTARLAIYNTSGSLVRSQSFHADRGEHVHRLNLAGLPNGKYICRVSLGGTTQNHPLLIAR